MGNTIPDGEEVEGLTSKPSNFGGIVERRGLDGGKGDELVSVTEGIAAVVAGISVQEVEVVGSMVGAGGVTEGRAVGAMSVVGTGGCGGVNFSAA